MWCSAYRKSFEIKLKYESWIYSNSYSFTHNSVKLLRRLFGFYTSYVTTCSKSFQAFSMASMYDNMTYEFQDLWNKIAFIRSFEKYRRTFGVVSSNHGIRKSFPFWMCVLRQGWVTWISFFRYFFPTISMTRSSNLTTPEKMKINAVNCKNIANMFQILWNLSMELQMVIV